MMASLLLRTRTLAARTAARGLRSTAPGAARAEAPTQGIYDAHGKKFDWETFILKSDQTSAGLKLYHKLNLALIGLGPLALMLSPSSLNVPVDLVLGVMIPLHGHVGGNDLISDYAKKVTKAPWFDLLLRRSLVFVTAVTFLGLTKLNMQGPGVTESFKSVWRPRVKSDDR